ncbi:MAG: TolC family protein, partial [Candidatus Binatia bacterium]
MSDLVVASDDDGRQAARMGRAQRQRIAQASARRRTPAAWWMGAALVLAIAGCAVGPDFVKPEPEMPPAYRSELAPAEAASFADEPWFDVFNDATLRGLIDEALAANYDLQVATARVEQAQHQVGVTRSELFPQAGYQGAAQRGKTFIGPNVDNQTFNVFLGSFNLAWELDIWGRIRRAT